jgi:hypothetical protein
MATTIMNLVTPKAAAKHELLFDKPTIDSNHGRAKKILKARGRFVEQMLMLSSSFKCDQIY